jgi:hypothetical protein
MSSSRLVLVISLVLISLVFVAAAYQIGRRVQMSSDDRGFFNAQATLAFGHYRMYGTIATELEKKCYDAALTEARQMRNSQIVILADSLRRTGNDAKLLEYIRLRDADLLKSVLAGHTPELRTYMTTCP